MPLLLQHELITDNENYNLNSPHVPPGTKAQQLISYLKSKGDEIETLQKFLCCLNSETQHTGHKSIAAELAQLLDRYHQGLQVACSICNYP